jgi:ferritin-like metal-binding protein YciE
MKEFKGSAALDAGVLASAQAIEHGNTSGSSAENEHRCTGWEASHTMRISRYGTLKEQLGPKEAVAIDCITYGRRER